MRRRVVRSRLEVAIAEPSQADQALTRRLKDALSLIDVKIFDHLIVAERVFSFSAAGIL
jgi:DNA repair protein RadC